MFSFGGVQPQGNTMFTAKTGGENAGIVARKFKKAVRRTNRQQQHSSYQKRVSSSEHIELYCHMSHHILLFCSILSPRLLATKPYNRALIYICKINFERTLDNARYNVSMDMKFRDCSVSIHPSIAALKVFDGNIR